MLKRLWRWTFSLLAGLSLVVALAALGMIVRSQYIRDTVSLTCWSFTRGEALGRTDEGGGLKVGFWDFDFPKGDFVVKLNGAYFADARSPDSQMALQWITFDFGLVRSPALRWRGWPKRDDEWGITKPNEYAHHLSAGLITLGYSWERPKNTGQSAGVAMFISLPLWLITLCSLVLPVLWARPLARWYARESRTLSGPARRRFLWTGCALAACPVAGWALNQMGECVFSRVLYPYQGIADRVPWRWSDAEARTSYSLAKMPSDYKGSTLSSGPTGFMSPTIIVTSADGARSYSWSGGRESTFRIIGNWLYYARYVDFNQGADIIAIDLKTGAKLWSTRLFTLDVVHSAYSNKVCLESDGAVITVRGNETYIRYLAILDAKSGRYLGYHNYSRAPDPYDPEQQPDLNWHWPNWIGTDVGWVLCALVISRFLWLAWLTRFRRDAGLCIHCGYNLTAHQTGQRCPECGTVIKAPNQCRLPESSQA